ncbi:MAG: CRP/FNR family cyclic AMP-dependent transcriptional regulator [Candidatus Azotimanducaceae bacterium]|jgi:CRP/FNR family cyclic AMP-dependent transcriptional regulator
MHREISPNDLISFIKASPWFAGVPATCQQALAAVAVVEKYPSKCYLYGAGDRDQYIYGVYKGRVNFSLNGSQGQCFAITDLQSGQWFNDAALAGDIEHISEIQIRSEAILIKLPKSIILEQAEIHPCIYRNLFHQEVTISKDLYKLFADMMFYPLPARFAARLLHLAQQHGELRDDGIHLHLELSQTDFGQLCMGSRQRINKILCEWQAAGLVTRCHQGYVIADPEGLAATIEKH